MIHKYVLDMIVFSCYHHLRMEVPLESTFDGKLVALFPASPRHIPLLIWSIYTLEQLGLNVSFCTYENVLELYNNYQSDQPVMKGMNLVLKLLGEREGIAGREELREREREKNLKQRICPTLMIGDADHIIILFI